MDLSYGFDSRKGKYQNALDEYCVIARVESRCGLTALVSIEHSNNHIRREILILVFNLVLLLLILYVFVCGVIFFIVKKNVTKPAKTVSNAMNAFLENGSRDVARLDEKRRDEFGSINTAFNHMSDNIDMYIRNITELNEQQQHRKAEMDIASNIQKGFLPDTAADLDGCCVRALMTPAQDIGGDLYDYLRLDDERVLIMIADVSGKGLSAAMFMSAALMLMHQYALDDCSPAAILEKTNRLLNRKNPSMLFVTAFVGIFHARTREFTYSDAGHNSPYLLSRNGARTLEDARSAPLGLFDDETYSQATVRLSCGDTLFLYTDGVTEAVGSDGSSFYGVGRLEKALNAYRPAYHRSLIEDIHSDVYAFAGKTPQADDITMLTLTVKTEVSLTLPAAEDSLDTIRELLLKSEIPRETCMQLCLAAVNICSYSGADTVEFTLALSDHILMTFADDGRPYDPGENVVSADEYDPDAQIGGLGKLIIYSIADDVAYEYVQNKNKLTIIKYLEEEI